MLEFVLGRRNRPMRDAEGDRRQAEDCDRLSKWDGLIKFVVQGRTAEGEETKQIKQRGRGEEEGRLDISAGLKLSVS
jgi:hypothetical protein